MAGWGVQICRKGKVMFGVRDGTVEGTCVDRLKESSTQRARHTVAQWSYQTVRRSYEVTLTRTTGSRSKRSRAHATTVLTERLRWCGMPTTRTLHSSCSRFAW